VRSPREIVAAEQALAAAWHGYHAAAAEYRRLRLWATVGTATAAQVDAARSQALASWSAVARVAPQAGAVPVGLDDSPGPDIPAPPGYGRCRFCRRLLGTVELRSHEHAHRHKQVGALVETDEPAGPTPRGPRR